MAEYMLDTSAIGEINDGAVDARKLYSSPDDFYITHIQEDELDDAGHSQVLHRVLDVVDAIDTNTRGLYGICQSGIAQIGGLPNTLS